MEFVKENIREPPPVPAWVLVCALAATLSSLAVAVLIDRSLPEPLTRAAPAHRFIAEIAHEHLVNLTSIGPRVAGSYENEVLAVGVLVAALRAVGAAASPHNVLDIDVQRASGAFDLAFFDGLNNVYSDVQSVVARARAVGAEPGRGARTAVLINCHFDTVPDSPGASDDGAGCAVALETLRALVAAPRPLPHHVLVLLNGAEENIMQASHAFVTQHKWAGSVRSFINIEACGAGGREVLFQAGPHDPWLMEEYARRVPHPFASSLAQELFQSGLVPADTDFRVFRDFGKLSGVDLAWSSNGYVYHTHLDTADRIPLGTLQRTGDNVLALATGWLESEGLQRAVDPQSRQPVFFDVLGALVLLAAPARALLAALLALALVALRIHCSAGEAARLLFVRRAQWWRAVGGAAALSLGAGGAALGAAGAAGAGAALWAGAPLYYYSRPWLLAPLAGAPAAAVYAALMHRAIQRPMRALGGAVGGRGGGRGWWRARLAAEAGAALWAALLAGCAALGLRSGFVPLLWAALPTLADLLAALLQLRGRSRAWLWALGSSIPVLQTSYLALDWLAMFIPLCGRAGSPPIPPDVVAALVVAALTLAVCSWLAPLVVAARRLPLLACTLAALGAACTALALGGALGAPYSAERPQRLMVLHVRRAVHDRVLGDLRAPDHYYWVPELDANTARTIDGLPGWGGRTAVGVGAGAECDRWVYCGAPYFLPVLGLVGAAHRVPAPAPAHAAPPAHAALDAHVTLDRDIDIGTGAGTSGHHLLNITVTGPSHVAVIVSPARGGRVLDAWAGRGGAWPERGEAWPGRGGAWPGRGGAWPVREAAPWAERRTYFVTMHAARRPHAEPRRLLLRLLVPEGAAQAGGPARAEVAQVSLAGHGMGGARGAALDQQLRRLPASVAPTGWPVHLHLYRL